MTFSEIVQKKVAGIPVLYLAGAFVVILALVAWKMPSSSGGSKDNTEVPSEGDAGAEPDYTQLVPSGTVTTVANPVQPAEPVTPTNEQWGRSAVEYLIESKLATPSEAELAISKYLSGNDLSFAEGKLKDAAIAKLKLPPEPLGALGKVSTQPAQRQFSNYPGKHTVKNENDNSFAKLAQLYYGRSGQAYTDSIASRNTNLARYGYFNPGTVVIIPGYTEPKYYTAGSQTLEAIAAKSGLSKAGLQALNPNMVFPVKKGTKVRVR